MTDAVNSGLSTTVGSASSIYLKPGDDVAAIVNAAAAGSTFIFSAGIYHNISITPKSSDTFIGQSGAVLDGSIPINGWSSANGYWSAAGFPTPGYSYGEGRDGIAQIPEDLVVGGTPYQRVGSLAEVGPGKFFYKDGKAFITDNPTGKTTSAMKTTAAFNGDNTVGVTIKNLTVQNYASIAQHGAIEAHKSSGWTLTDVNAVNNHGAGLAGGSNMAVVGGNYSGNGQVGIHAFVATNLSISGVTADHNNYAGYAQTWDAGGIKILDSNNVSIANSDISSNNGVGLWFDTDNQNVSVANNTIKNNQSVGLLYEASFAASVTNNTIANNAQSGYVDGYWGSGLLILSSSHVTASQNTIVVNDGAQGIGMQEDGRAAYLLSAPVVAYNTIQKNTIVLLGRGLNGGAGDGMSSSTIYGGTNVWSNNTYIAKNAKMVDFTWNATAYWAADLHNPPIDANGTFLYNSDPMSMIAPKVAITSQTLAMDNGVDPTDNITTDGQIALAGTMSGRAGSLVEIYDGTKALGAASLAADGKWAYATNLPVGAHALSAVVSDPSGKTAATPPEPTVTVTTAAPVGQPVTPTPPPTGSAVPASVPTTTSVAKAVPSSTPPSAATPPVVSPKLSTATTPVPAKPAGPDLLTLKLSEDAYKGDAQFTISVDGKQVGGVQSVTALHSQGKTQTFTAAGDFGVGQHTVGINFLNDLWGGTPSSDRNLYVKSIDLNGTTVNENREQAGKGVVNYKIQAASSPSDLAFVHAGATLIMNAAAKSGLVDFAGSTGVLQLNHPQDFGGRIAGFAGSDTIDLRSISFNAISSASVYSPGVSSGVLTVKDGVNTTKLAFLGDYKASGFHFASDGHGGTAVTLAH